MTEPTNYAALTPDYSRVVFMDPMANLAAKSPSLAWCDAAEASSQPARTADQQTMADFAAEYVNGTN